MHVIRVRNVCEALPRGMHYLASCGERQESRAGRVLVAPEPVVTVYERPQERVLTSPARDANPFFHLAEAIWMLAGRRGVEFLNYFVHDFGERFAEDDGLVHGAYGHRWRAHFGQDQLRRCIGLLRENPADRQVVLTMWDPEADLAIPDLKDRPCNTHVYFRIQSDKSLDTTVCCRSNDAVWGAYGANAVHFSFLQEYVASSVGCAMGRYYQVSNNFHMYEDVYKTILKRGPVTVHQTYRPSTRVVSLMYNPGKFDQEMRMVLQEAERLFSSGRGPGDMILDNLFLSDVFWPAMCAWFYYKNGTMQDAIDWCDDIVSDDWRQACSEWLLRRAERRNKVSEVRAR